MNTSHWISTLLFALSAGNALACSAPPAAVIDIEANRYYTDKHNSIIDPVLRAKNIASVKPIDNFLDAVAHDASNYQAAPGKALADAQCGLKWMESWADQKALLGKMSSNQAYYTRKWTLGGLAMSYAKLKPAASEAQKRSVESWLKLLAEETVAHSDAYKGERNNHYYWEGLAVTATGAVTGDARFLAWGRKVFDEAMSQVAADGSLPREMDRAVKALHYHLFAVTPLVMMASILDIQSPRLDQLVKFTLDGVADPSYIQTKTGFEQERPHEPNSWKAIYDRHTCGPRSPAEPTNWQPRLGGDLNLANPLEHPLMQGKPQAPLPAACGGNS
jgi:poly(beta-D-mannuronate) lyase